MEYQKNKTPKNWGVKLPTCLGIFGILKIMLLNLFFLNENISTKFANY
jgi:hypothetical protein